MRAASQWWQEFNDTKQVVGEAVDKQQQRSTVDAMVDNNNDDDNDDDNDDNDEDDDDDADDDDDDDDDEMDDDSDDSNNNNDWIAPVHMITSQLVDDNGIVNVDSIMEQCLLCNEMLTGRQPLRHVQECKFESVRVFVWFLNRFLS
jgi:hypothetical protein